MKWLVDIDALVAEGMIDAAEGAELKARARAEAVSLGVNLLLIGGILAVMAGLFALAPTPMGLVMTGGVLAGLGGLALWLLGPRHRLPANAAAVIGLASMVAGSVGLAIERTGSTAPAIWIGLALIAVGLGTRALGPPALGIAAAWAAVFGLAAHLTGVFGLEGTSIDARVAMLDAAGLLLLLGVALDIRLLSALSVVALAGILAAADYAHASYVLAIFEPTAAILLMGGIAAGAAWCAARARERLSRHGRIVGLMALIWVNLAFWVGSLWGDRPGEYLLAPSAADHPVPEALAAAREAWRAGLVEIPSGAFALGWAGLIIAVGAWAALSGRRSVLNAAVTFGAIHFYTQWFERLESAPEAIIGAGVVAIAAAWGVVRLNAWLAERAAGR